MMERKRFTLNVDTAWLQEETEEQEVSTETIIERIIDAHIMNHPLTGVIEPSEAKMREDRHLKLAETLCVSDCITWTTNPRREDIMVHEGLVRMAVRPHGYWNREGEWTRNAPDILQSYDTAWQLGVQPKGQDNSVWLFLREMRGLHTGWGLSLGQR